MIVVLVKHDHLHQKNFLAFKYVKKKLESGDNIFVYFLLNGAYAANTNIKSAPDEINLSHSWQELANNNHKITLAVCQSSQVRRGVQIADGFRVGTIGEFVENCNCAVEFKEF